MTSGQTADDAGTGAPGSAAAHVAGTGTPGAAVGPTAGAAGASRAAVRVFISYAKDDPAHEDTVREFWLFLRAQGIDARLDLSAAEQRLDWPQWMTREIRDAERVLVIASPAYRLRAEGDVRPDEGRGVQWEAKLIRDRIYDDQPAGLDLVLPVILPGCSAADIPRWLGRASTTHYVVSDFTVSAVERLLRQVLGRPWETEPPLGAEPELPPRENKPTWAATRAFTPGATAAVARATADEASPNGPARPALVTQVLIEAGIAEDGRLTSSVSVAGAVLCQREVPLPDEVASVWSALELPAAAASDRMAEAGRRLATAVLDDDAGRLLAALLNGLRPGDRVEMTLTAAGPALSLPVELIRLTTDAGTELSPLALLPGVSVSRHLAVDSLDTVHSPGTPGRGGKRSPSATQRPGIPHSTGTAQASGAAQGAGGLQAVGTAQSAGGALRSAGEPLPGPLKILAAVAAPDETKTPNSALDVEAEMQAVLDAVADVAGHAHAQVRILEVASLPAIRQALDKDAYHVLHLSAHGSPTSIELEDEDGAPVAVTPESLMGALRQADRPVPLIVLSSCSGGSGSQAMAASLLAQGADRVIAMLAAVSDDYATTLARHLYRELAARPESTAGQALARARCLTEEERLRLAGDQLPSPEYGVATLLTAGGDRQLVDSDATGQPLEIVTIAPEGQSVRELPMGALIGRRAQLRTAMGTLRRTERAVARSGIASGVQLTGIGGIGKTAVAGRIMSRLRSDGWLIAVHEGRWNPTMLITAVAEAIAETPPDGDGKQAAAFQKALAPLADPAVDDGPKLAAIRTLLGIGQLLLLFDDFEQNLASGGDAFLDPAIDEVITGLADAASTGALLVTCRYPLPGPDRFLTEVPIPPLSAAELRRLFLRLPALRELDAADRQLLTRTIGGHPRLIEFTDALLRGGHSNFRHVQLRLRDLAKAEGIDIARDQSLRGALDQAMILGSANILLTELVSLLSPQQTDILLQIAVGRAPMTLDDLAFALPQEIEPTALQTDVHRLTDLTLLTPGAEIVIHPWTAELITRNAETDLDPQYERALTMRRRRFEQQRGTYEDLIDIPRHLADLHRYDEVASMAEEAVGLVSGTLATVAYLAEVRPLVPAEERAWSVIADLEVATLMASGDLGAAKRLLEAAYGHDLTRAAADPANTQWQRDLSVSHNRLGNLAVTAGDLTAARTAYQGSLDIAARLTAADPANTQWQRDLSISHTNLGGLAAAAGDIVAARTAYQASLDIAERLAASDPANNQWQQDVQIIQRQIAGLADRPRKGRFWRGRRRAGRQ
jgi:tetratricopeptide (TPR) repeat protein